MLWNILILTTIRFVTTVSAAENNATKYDGYFGTCPLSIFDLTLSSKTTDSLQIRLMVGNEPDHIYNISRAASLINDKAFRKDFRTVFYIHGWMDDSRSNMASKIRESYQARGRHNVIFLDASTITSSILYPRSSRASRYIGVRLGKVLTQMIKSGLNVETLDLIGFSLGAHIAGYTAKSYFKTTGKKLPRLVGLDPTGICFSASDSSERLDKNDAQFVQILHTNGGGAGIMGSIGHIDFYVNGGRRQPGEYGFGCFYFCSHFRAVDVWTYSVVYPDKFIGTNCESIEEIDRGMCRGQKRKKAVMGPAANPKIQGIFYITTTKKPPYFLEPRSEAFYYLDPWCYK